MRADPIATYTLIVLELAVTALVVWCKVSQALDKTRFVRDVNALERQRWISKF